MVRGQKLAPNSEPQTMRRSKRLAEQVEQALTDAKQNKPNDDRADVEKSREKTKAPSVKKEKAISVRTEKEAKNKKRKTAKLKANFKDLTDIKPSAERLKETGGGDATMRESSSLMVSSRPAREMAGFTAKGWKFVGAHTSSAGGVWNAVMDALTIKGRALAFFLKSQRQWKAKPLEEDVITKFKATLVDSGYHPDFILPHGSYLLNCGSPNPETLQKSREALLDEVQRCQRLGLNRYNFHPGSTCGEMPVEKCLELIAASINDVLDKTSGVTLVVENMSCQGNTVGGKFEELRGIIDRVEDKSRIGICLDTCHAFAAGYDLSTEAGYCEMTDDFEKIIGFQYLKGVHLNDSKGKVGCHLDRHENIGKGYIKLKGFKRLMNDRRFDNVPMILETPPGASYEKEIDLLYSLVD